jgi:hypothetical protein
MSTRPIPLPRYAPGGDIYQQLAAAYGAAGAEAVYQAARTGDRAAISEALANVRLGPKRDDSVGSIFWSQVTTDPFAAPLETLNQGLGAAFTSAIVGVFKNPWVLASLLAVGVFLAWRNSNR